MQMTFLTIALCFKLQATGGSSLLSEHMRSGRLTKQRLRQDASEASCHSDEHAVQKGSYRHGQTSE